MSVVELKGISRRYGDVTALKSLDLYVNKGEFLTLLGPSGSGKTTLLNIIAGMISPSSGQIEIDGRDVTHLPTRQRGLGMVFQNYALMPQMTVFENVAFPLRVRRVREQDIRVRVAEVLDSVHLKDYADRKPRELSGGQQQRVSIARCLVYHPELILMDEPLGALDKRLREQLQLEIKRLHSELGITVIYVTHDQEEALSLSDRIALMNAGGIEQLGAPHDLYFAPRTLFAAQFLGESNAFPAKIMDRNADETVLRTANGAILKSLPTDIAVGTDVTVIVRPENIRRLEGGQSLSNEIQGDLVETAFIGGVTNYYIKPDFGDVILLKELTDKVLWNSQSQKVRLGWDKQYTIIVQ